MSHEEDNVVGDLVSLCRSMDIQCVVQVGAWDGWEADKIRLETGARAIAIDADPRAVTCSDHISHYKALIGEHDADEVVFHQNNAPGLSGKVGRGEAEKAIKMRQWSLDTFCTFHDARPDALIIDTEGTTLDVLRGANRLLTGVRLIYAECQTSEIRPGIVGLLSDVDAFLVERGFVRRPGPPAYDAGGQGNYCWVRK